MLEPTSENCGMAIETPLAKDKVVLESLSGGEAVSQLFEFGITVLSTDHEIDGKSLLGENVTVRMVAEGDSERYLNGYVCAFSQRPMGTENYARYQLVVRPWLWFLTRTADSRIFQEMTIPEIIKQVFRDAGFTDFEESLSGTYDSHENCVQYQETDFDFVSRLLEQEGICYYFRHENGKHTLILADHLDSHTTISEYEEVPFYVRDDLAVRERDHISQWKLEQSVMPGTFTTNSFSFENPKANLLATSTLPQEHAADGFKVYDYSGAFKTQGAGQRYADIRMEEFVSAFSLAEASGNVRGLASGFTFTLADFPRADQNISHLVLSVQHEMVVNGYESGDVVEDYQCSFTAMDASVQYRPPRRTPKPEMSGPQTAVVAGPAGEEIYVDQHARVKVIFPWDRYATGDDKSSWWIRVSQQAAGQSWGGIYTPRIGQEVIVDFLNGDPDRPIITGHVYNADNKPPYELPQKQTYSGFKSNSTKGGGGFNEFRFDDTKDKEEVRLHAQKNQEIKVRNNRYETIGNDRHLIVQNDKFEEIRNDRHETVENDHKEDIGKDRHLTIAGLKSTSVGNGLTLDVGAEGAITYGKDYSLVVGKDIYIKAENIVIEASTNITLKAGTSTLAMDDSGIKLENKGGTIALDSNKFDAKASLSAKIKAVNTDVNGDAVLNLKGGMANLKGNLVKIN